MAHEEMSTEAAPWAPPEVAAAPSSSSWSPPEADSPPSAAIPAASAPEQVSSPPPPTDWHALYAGLDGLDSRVTPAQRDGFGILDQFADALNPKESRARAINQAFIQTKNPEIPEWLMGNSWEGVKVAYAKSELGIDSKAITDTAFYGAIGQRLKEEADEEQFGTIKPWTWRDALGSKVRGGADTLGRFWESINQPAVKLAEAPRDLPNIPALGISNPAIVGGVWNALKPLVEGLESPFGIATLGTGASLSQAGKIYPAARVALASMSGIFAGLMGYQTVEGVKAAPAILNDPNASFQDKVEAVASPVATGAAAILGALGTAMEILPPERSAPLAAKLKDKTPAEGAKILREEAAAITVEAEKAADRPAPAPMDAVNSELRAKIDAIQTIATGGEPSAAKPPEASTKPKAPPAVQSDFLMTAADELDRIASVADKERVAALPDTSAEKPVSQETPAQAASAESPIAAAEGKTPVKGAVYSIKNAAFDEMMQREGLPPATEREASSWDAARKVAADKIEADPAAGRNLVAELAATKRPVTDADQALLLHEEVRLALERRAAEAELVAAAESADPAAVEVAKVKIDGIRQELVTLAEVSKQSGNETGRALAFRRAMMREDYSLAAMETRRSVANEGRPLTDAQAAEVKKLHDERAAIQAAFDEYKSRMSELLMSDDSASRPRRAREPGKPKPPGAVVKFLSEQADAARKRIEERMRAGYVRSGLDPVDVADHIIVGAHYIAKGVGKFAEWSEVMAKEFGEAIRPHLETIFAGATEKFTNAAKERSIAEQAKRIETRIAELEKKISEGDLSASPEKLNRPAVEPVEVLKQQRDALNAELDRMRREASAVPPEESKLKSFKTRTSNRIAELEKRIAHSDFSKPVRTPLHLDPEANRLQAKLNDVGRRYEAALERDRYQNSSTFNKVKENALNVYDTARLLMTTGEFSFILRQGKVGVLSHPIMAAKALPNTFRALIADPVAAEALNLEVLNHPEAAAARSAKLHLVEAGASLSKQEELLMGKIVGKELPVIKHLVKIPEHFNQAAEVFLNRMRFDMWRQMRKVGMSAAEEKQLAMFVNEATGRGGLGSLEAAAVPLGRVMFSPRYFASRVQLAAGHSLWGGTAATRRIIAGEYAKTLVGLGLYYTGLYLAFTAAGDEPKIGDDPRSSDFGKVKIGNSRIDPLAGVAQVIVFAARTATGEKATSSGRVRSIRGEGIPYGGQKWTDVAADFARSKLHPVPGAIANLFNGTDLGGNKADLTNQALNLSAPVTYMDIYQALEEQDLPEGVALGLLAMFGEGLQTYDANAKRRK
jgi:uncharacterized coiled-coil protein SlyX